MTRIQWLADGDLRPGLFRLDSLLTEDTMRELAKARGWHFFAIEGEGLSNKREFLAAFATIMKFPSYFGFNWDAFLDSLTDLGWLQPDVRGLVIYFKHFAAFADNAPEEVPSAIDCLNSAIDRWWLRQVPLYVLFAVETSEAKVLNSWLPLIQKPWQMPKA